MDYILYLLILFWIFIFILINLNVTYKKQIDTKDCIIIKTLNTLKCLPINKELLVCNVTDFEKMQYLKKYLSSRKNNDDDPNLNFWIQRYYSPINIRR